MAQRSRRGVRSRRRRLQCCNAAPYRRRSLTRRGTAEQRSARFQGATRQADCMWVRNNKGNVFVGNLPPDFADERLAEAFDPFGIVLSAVVARDPETGARLRYGFVDIASERAANQAISALDGSLVDGCKLNVKPREKPVKKPGVPPKRRPPAMRATRPVEPRREAVEAVAPREFTEDGPLRRSFVAAV